MTWSIVARDAATGRIGIAVASKFFAVGSLVPHVRAGVGAIATQALVNPYYGPRGLALLASGASADEAVNLLTIADEGRDNRQVHAVDGKGRVAAFTGAAAVDWAGQVLGDGFSVAGNMLAGPAVVERTAAEYAARTDLPFAQRLVAALAAGEAAGGDKRGRQAAALRVHDAEDYPLYDLRVDDHADPIAELARLEGVARERWLHFRRAMPNAADPTGIRDRGLLEGMIAQSIADGYL